MEIDSVPQQEVNQIRLLNVPPTITNPLDIDLQSRCSIFLQDLGVTSTTTPRLPVDIAQVIFDYAFTKGNTTSSAALLESLSDLLAIEGIAKNVIHAFGPVLSDLLARWLENADSIGSELWEARLSTIAYLAALRPDLWTYVLFIVSY